LSLFHTKQDHTFYTNAKSSGIIPPKLESIDAFNKEIDDKEKALAALNKRQFELMLLQDTVGMSASDKDIAEAEKQRDMLKSQMGQVMGIGSERKGNLLAGNLTLAEQSAEQKDIRPQYVDGDVPKPYTMMGDDGQPATKKRNYTYGSAPDDFADTGLVEPPKINTAYGSDPDDYAETGLKSPKINTAYGSDPDDLADTGLGELDDPIKYSKEKQQRSDALMYMPSQDFASLVDDGMKAAQANLNKAKQLGDANLIKKFEEEANIYDTIADMYTNVNVDNTFRYYQMEEGLKAVASLSEMYEEEMNNAVGLTGKDAAQKLDMLKGQILAINKGMNVVGEAYLDEVDKKWKDNKITWEQNTQAYRDYYQSVIDRERSINVSSRSLKEENLTMANASTSNDFALFGILEGLDVPLYKTEKDAVFAFKKEAMPLTLQANKEYSAVLDCVEVLDVDTGQVDTYYYYIDAKQGAENNVIFNAIMGAGGGPDRKLLHTHPVTGGWNRNFSGDPQNQGLFNKNPGVNAFWGEMGDTNVPTSLGYGGIYVVGSGAEVKLYEGYGNKAIGSGYNTHANTKEELMYVSTIDLY
jgi:hypothetical protein